MIDYKEMGKRIRMLRKKAHMTQAILAEKLEISTSFLGHIERGTRILSLETLVRIAGYFDVLTDYLILGDLNTADEQNSKNAKKARMLNKLMQMLNDNDDWIE